MNRSDSAILMAQVKLYRDLERAYGEHAQNLAAVLGEDVIEAPVLRGAVQRRITPLPNLATIEGMTAAQIARELDYDEANTYTALKGLEKLELVELVEDSNPRRWRLTVKHRRNRVLRLSRLIPPGRWTTYGEFSIAVYDSQNMARTIGRIAAKNPAFANPHRVLSAGGTVNENWNDGHGGGPEVCKERLREEKVWMTREDKADPDCTLGWEELQRMLKEAEADEELDQVA